MMASGYGHHQEHNAHNPDPKILERRAKGLGLNRSVRSLRPSLLLSLALVAGLLLAMWLKDPRSEVSNQTTTTEAEQQGNARN